MAAAGSAPLKPSRAARVSWIVFVRRVASSIVWGRCSLPGCGRVSRDNAGEIGQFFLAPWRLCRGAHGINCSDGAHHSDRFTAPQVEDDEEVGIKASSYSTAVPPNTARRGIRRLVKRE